MSNDEPKDVEWSEMWKHLVSGALARASAGSILFPFDTVKARLQFQPGQQGSIESQTKSSLRRHYKGMSDAFRWIAREEGMLAFYRGLPVRLMYITPSAAVSFALYEQFKRMFHNHFTLDSSERKTNRLEPLVWLAAGASARLLGTAVRTPFDIVKQRLQVQGSLKNPLYSSTFAALNHVVTKEGFTGLFQGYACTIMRDVPFAALYFTSYETFKLIIRRRRPLEEETNQQQQQQQIVETNQQQQQQQQIVETNQQQQNSEKLSTPHHLLAGACAGALAASVTLPMDVVKLKLQTQNALPIEERTYRTIPQTWKTIWQREGIRGFYKGWGPVLLKVTPAASLTFACYEAYKRLLDVE